MARHKEFQLADRAQVVTLKDIGWTNKQITAYTGVSVRSIQQMCATARGRGYDPSVSKTLEDDWLRDKPRSDGVGRERATGRWARERLMGLILDGAACL